MGLDEWFAGIQYILVPEIDNATVAVVPLLSRNRIIKIIIVTCTDSKYVVIRS